MSAIIILNYYLPTVTVVNRIAKFESIH